MYDCDSTVFFDIWNKSKDKIEAVLASYGSIDDFDTPFHVETEKMLMLLKLFPLRQHGKTTARQRLSFQQAIEKLIVFAQVSYFLMTYI